MLTVITAFVCTFMSFCTGLLFNRANTGRTLLNAAIAGLLAGGLTWLLQDRTPTLLPLLLVLICVLLIPAVILQRKVKVLEALLAGLVTVGEQALLLFTQHAFSDVYSDAIGGWIAIGTAVLSVPLLASVKQYFPEENWKDCFSETSGNVKVFPLKIVHVYMVAATGTVGTLLALFLLRVDSLASAIAVVLILLMLYVGSVLGVILLLQHKRLTIAVDTERQYRGEMQTFMNVIRSQRHDYNFHVQTLASMINNGDVEASRTYINELVEDTGAMNTMLPVADPAIAAMIHSFRVSAARDGIELSIDIRNDLSAVVTNAYETNKIISNLLQNAIDEVKTHKDKRFGIRLSIFKRGEFCDVHVVNELGEVQSEEEYLASVFKQGYTTKQGHDGVGLSSIQSLLKRYHGLIYPYIEDNTIHFVAEIPLKV